MTVADEAQKPSRVADTSKAALAVESHELAASTTPSSTAALTDEEVTQLRQELAVLQEQPRAQMVGHLVDIHHASHSSTQ